MHFPPRWTALSWRKLLFEGDAVSITERVLNTLDARCWDTQVTRTARTLLLWICALRAPQYMLSSMSTLPESNSQRFWLPQLCPKITPLDTTTLGQRDSAVQTQEVLHQETSVEPSLCTFLLLQK